MKKGMAFDAIVEEMKTYEWPEVAEEDENILRAIGVLVSEGEGGEED